MRITCVGAGPAGLYFAISAKRRDPRHDIRVIERSAQGASYGWGVVYWDNLLDMLFDNDMESARRIRRASRLWQEQEVWLRDQAAYLPGYGYSITRTALIDILRERAHELGVDVRGEETVDELPAPEEADLVVGADGAGSRVRGRYERQFGTRLSHGTNRYLWLGTSRLFDRFSFAFEPTDAGWIWFHAYPSSARTSTCIVETTDTTWNEAGFAQRDTENTLRLLEKTFDQQLQGHELFTSARGRTPPWQQFVEVTNRTWVHRDGGLHIALLGDAAHTTHFTIGSGTRLAMIDAVALAQALFERPGDPAPALAVYDRRRRPALEQTQASACASMEWFQNVDRYVDQSTIDFAYSMSCRQGQQPRWHYQRHLMNQFTPTRLGRRYRNTVRRWHGAARRGERPLLPSRLLRGSTLTTPAANASPRCWSEPAAEEAPELR